MAEIDATDLLKVRTVCYTPTQIGVNVLHFRVLTVSVIPVTTLDVAQHFDALLAPLYKPCLSSDARWRGVGVQNTKIPPSVEESNVTRDGLGTAGGGLMPTQSSGLITKESSISARSKRGRMYVPFPSIGHGDANGSANLPYVLVLIALGTALEGVHTVTTFAGGSATMELHIRSRVGGVTTSVKVQAMRARPRFATQRRRGQYGQGNTVPF